MWNFLVQSALLALTASRYFVFGQQLCETKVESTQVFICFYDPILIENWEDQFVLTWQTFAKDEDNCITTFPMNVTVDPCSYFVSVDTVCYNALIDFQVESETFTSPPTNSPTLSSAPSSSFVPTPFPEPTLAPTTSAVPSASPLPTFVPTSTLEPTTTFVPSSVPSSLPTSFPSAIQTQTPTRDVDNPVCFGGVLCCIFGFCTRFPGFPRLAKETESTDFLDAVSTGERLLQNTVDRCSDCKLQESKTINEVQDELELILRELGRELVDNELGVYFRPVDLSFPSTCPPSQPPSGSPSVSPTLTPTAAPSQPPSGSPSVSPTFSPTAAPSKTPSAFPSSFPSSFPSDAPSISPSESLFPSIQLTPQPIGKGKGKGKSKGKGIGMMTWKGYAMMTWKGHAVNNMWNGNQKGYGMMTNTWKGMATWKGNGNGNGMWTTKGFASQSNAGGGDKRKMFGAHRKNSN